MQSKQSTKPRKLPQQDRSRITVEAILESTARILAEEGYDKANTNYIAQRAGISVGSLYQYFPNKESLMAALLKQHSNEIAELIESKLNNLFNSPPKIVVPELVKAVITAHSIDPQLHQVLNEEIPRSERLQHVENADKRIAELLQAYLIRWSDYIQPQNLEITIFIVSRTVESLCHSAVIERPGFVSDGQFEKEVSNLLISYLTRSLD
jgi:AcrR family transcriptional regulator